MTPAQKKGASEPSTATKAEPEIQSAKSVSGILFDGLADPSTPLEYEASRLPKGCDTRRADYIWMPKDTSKWTARHTTLVNNGLARAVSPVNHPDIPPNAMVPGVDAVVNGPDILYYGARGLHKRIETDERIPGGSVHHAKMLEGMRVGSTNEDSFGTKRVIGTRKMIERASGDGE